MPERTLTQIAAELPGFEPDNLRAEHVTRFLDRLVAPVRETEELGIFEALGRVLASDLISPISVPPHDNSAMDGYAFDGRALRAGEPLQLRIMGKLLAGDIWQGQTGPGEAVRITTGAMLPRGLDTVVPQELAQCAGDRLTVPADVLRQGDNRRPLGEDLMQGQAALRGGELLGPAALGLVASLGIARVTVRRRLRVAYFSTGNEILSLGEPARSGAVYDSNRYTVFGMLSRLGAEVVDLGVVRDDPLALEEAFREAAHRADAIVTSGGVSAGEADHTRVMMRKLAGGSGGVAFWRIAMRPGRPMAVGRIAVPEGAGGKSAVLFGLPGNPVAVMVSFLAFVRPALLKMMGATATAQPMLRARSAAAIRKKPGRTEFQRGTVGSDAHGGLQVTSAGNQGSGVLRSMAQANCLIVLHHDRGDVAPGDEVDLMMFDGAL